MLDRFVSCLISLRTFLALALLTLFFVALYTWLPYERQDIRLQLPGALISTVGWIGCSYGFPSTSTISVIILICTAA